MRKMPRRSGRKVKNWLENLFSPFHCKQRTVPREAAQGRGEERLCGPARDSGQASDRLRRVRTLQSAAGELEITLLDSAYQRSTASRDDVLMDAAKRYRVDTEKVQKAVAKDFAA